MSHNPPDQFPNPRGWFPNPQCDFTPNPRCEFPNPRCEFSFLGLGRHLDPLPLTVNCSYFALFSLNTCDLDVFLDVNYSSWSSLAFWHYAAILGWLITAAQWKNYLMWHTLDCSTITHPYNYYRTSSLIFRFFLIIADQFMDPLD